MKVYKIYNPETGLYSAGGTKLHSLWTKNGKAWSINALNGHLRVFKRSCRRESSEILELYKKCEIHEFEAEPTVLDIKDFL